MTLLLALLPGTSLGITLEEAARKAAKEYDARVLSARTVVRKGDRIHEIKLVTEDGVVKTVRIPEGEKRKDDKERGGRHAHPRG